MARKKAKRKKALKPTAAQLAVRALGGIHESLTRQEQKSEEAASYLRALAGRAATNPGTDYTLSRAMDRTNAALGDIRDVQYRTQQRIEELIAVLERSLAKAPERKPRRPVVVPALAALARVVFFPLIVLARAPKAYAAWRMRQRLAVASVVSAPIVAAIKSTAPPVPPTIPNRPGTFDSVAGPARTGADIYG